MRIEMKPGWKRPHWREIAEDTNEEVNDAYKDFAGTVKDLAATMRASIENGREALQIGRRAEAGVKELAAQINNGVIAKIEYLARRQREQLNNKVTVEKTPDDEPAIAE